MAHHIIMCDVSLMVLDYTEDAFNANFGDQSSRIFWSWNMRKRKKNALWGWFQTFIACTVQWHNMFCLLGFFEIHRCRENNNLNIFLNFKDLVREFKVVYGLSENYLKIKYILKIWSTFLKLNYYKPHKPFKFSFIKIVTTWILDIANNPRVVSKKHFTYDKP